MALVRRLWLLLLLLLLKLPASRSRSYFACQGCLGNSAGTSCKSLVSTECFPDSTCDRYTTCTDNVCNNAISLCTAECDQGFRDLNNTEHVRAVCRNPSPSPTFAPTNPIFGRISKTCKH